LAVVLVFSWATYDWLRLRRLSERATAVEIYRRMRRYGARLLVALEAGDTPYEYAAILSLRIQELASQGLNQGFVLSTSRLVQSITDQIVRISYRPVQPESMPTFYLQHQWRVLRWRLRLMLILKNWKEVRDHFYPVEKKNPENMTGASGDHDSRAEQEE